MLVGREYKLKSFRSNPIIVTVLYSDEGGSYVECRDGRFIVSPEETYLYELVPKTVRKSGWINIYRGRRAGQVLYGAKETAQKYGGEVAVASVLVEWEEEEVE